MKKRKGACSRLADNPANRKKTKCQIVSKLCTPSESPESEHSGPNPSLPFSPLLIILFHLKSLLEPKIKDFPSSTVIFCLYTLMTTCLTDQIWLKKNNCCSVYFFLVSLLTSDRKVATTSSSAHMHNVRAEMSSLESGGLILLVREQNNEAFW